MPETPSELYRDEALQHHRRAHGAEGELLRASPAWLTASSYLLLALLLAAVAFGVFARIPETLPAPGVLREGGEAWAAVATEDAAKLAPGMPVVVTLPPPQAALRGRILAIDAAPRSKARLAAELGLTADKDDVTYVPVRCALEAPHTLEGLRVTISFPLPGRRPVAWLLPAVAHER